MAQFAARLPVAATYQRLKAGGHFDKRKGFTEIIVGTQTQPLDALVERIPCGQDQHWLAAALFPPFAQDLQPVNTGQGQVEHHGVIGGAVERRSAGFTLGEPVQAKAQFRQSGLNAVANQLVVFYQ